MRIIVERKLYSSIEAKDLILHIVRTIRFASAIRYIIEYTSSIIRNMSIEARITICNILIEVDRRVELIASNDIIFRYLKERLFILREY
jgi:3-isopropylmalate/(R)-2-methylmalate dehydratase large subunit